MSGAGGTIAINGGTINVATNAGAGIGGGNSGSGGLVTITGGTITTSSSTGSGIGAGLEGTGGTVAIIGGSVKADGAPDISGTLTNGSETIALHVVPNAVAPSNPPIVTYRIPVTRSTPAYHYEYDYAGTGHGSGDTNLYFYLPTGNFTTATLLSSNNPATVGQNLIFTASVSPAAASGTVEYFDGAVLLGQATLSGGNAMFITNALTVGTHVISACYKGDDQYFGCYTNAISQKVNPATVVVTFNKNGGSTEASPRTRTVGYNLTVDPPTTPPTRTGYIFVGWYTNTTYKTAWNFATGLVTKDMTLYARWMKTAVTGVKASSASFNSIKLTWTADPGADFYDIYRAASLAGTYAKIKAGVTGSAYTNSGLAYNRTYYYKIRAYAMVNGVRVNNSSYSAVVSRNPSIPGNFTVARYSTTSLKISWSAVSGANGYQVWRATSAGGTYSLVKTITSGSTISNINGGLVAGKTYYYKVRAYKLVGTTNVYGGFTSIKYAKPIPSVPANFAVIRSTSTSIKTSWAAVSGASGYEVWRATSSGGTYARIMTTTSTSWINGSLAYRYYYYTVRAYRTVGTIRVYGGFTAVKYA